MSNLSEESLIFSFKTIQCTAFRILIEGMKEILNETNMIFDEGGIKILTTDNSHSVLVHVKLEGQHFEEYICNQKTMIGINLFYFYKLIRGIGNNDTLSVYMTKDNLNCIFIKIENSEKNFVSINSLIQFFGFYFGQVIQYHILQCVDLILEYLIFGLKIL